MAPIISQDILPLRVVDIAGTRASAGGICFKEPGGWDFHIISHTWSQGMRDLSRQIGNRLVREEPLSYLIRVCSKLVCGLTEELEAETSSSSSSLAYNRAFQETNFRPDPCFRALRRLFELLASDGVHDVWIDALCINQSDKKEKAREIPQMGEYYSRSRGCYVLTHGLDLGYNIWREVGTTPRWFTRVWTFQECLLPEHLVFIVSGIHPKTIECLNWCINTQRVRDFCKCALQKGWQHTRFILRDIGKGPEASTEIGGMCSRPCEKCGPADIRKLDQHGTPQEPIYLVDRDAYHFVAFMDFLVQTDPAKIKLIKEKEQFFLQQRDLVGWDQSDVRKTKNTSKKLSLHQILREISTRDCALEEDRVLSVLSLLRVKDLAPWAPGKTLPQQLIELAEVMRTCRLNDAAPLIELVALDQRGSPLPLMSWAPDLTSNNNRCAYIVKHLEKGKSLSASVQANQINVGMDGRIQLAGVKVSSIRVDMEAHKYLEDIKGHIIETKVAPESRELQVKFEKGSAFKGGFILSTRINCISTSSKTLRFDAWLVQLAQDVILVCMSKGSSAQDLHKIGVVSLDVKDCHRIFGDCVPHDCSLGGCGENIDDIYFDLKEPKPHFKWIIRDAQCLIREWNKGKAK